MESELKPKERFTGLAEDYAKARPGYSDEAIDFVLKHCHLNPGDIVADVGCGTGISSRAFASRGLKVVGIEPNADMRAQAELANEKNDLVVYKEGSAEHTGLLDQSCHAIVVAQAYHWFDADKALKEFVRILKPGGWVVLLWNLRNEEDPFSRAYGDLLRKFDEVFAKMETSQMAVGEEFLKNNILVEREKFVFKNQQIMDKETFHQRARSTSCLPKDQKTQELLIKLLNEIYDQHQNNGLVVLKYDLHLYMGRRP